MTDAEKYAAALTRQKAERHAREARQELVRGLLADAAERRLLGISWEQHRARLAHAIRRPSWDDYKPGKG